ncbi:hypothetical protein SCHPADRAFT_937713 [Schizopora paradoxa]|uniref:BTB domain-containing protein n=1 Tax=Schizopora paradoxa TaxID=27342 RepID=A0A0H2RX77_9AGAM|nr:hypothetical protein SCHPADRAFT_937713 [Schizopora paradoxa]
MDVDENSNMPKPHDLLWFSDGSVVLATDIYLFKVHKGLLSLHSSVFKDMFESLNFDGSVSGGIGTGGSQEMYEGLPLVTLVGDKGEDIAHLLRAVFEPRYHDRHSDGTPLETVVALLVLSTKYDFKNIRNDVIFQISRHYPMTFRDYLSKDIGHLPLFGRTREDCHFYLLNAAFRADIDVLLPTLYLACSDASIKSLLGTYAIMPSECVNRLLMGRESLVEQQDRLVADLPERLREAIGKNACRKGCSCLKKAFYGSLSELINANFGGLDGAFIATFHLNGVCSDCSPFVVNEINTKRQEIWKNIPEYFGCRSWDALQKKLKEISGPSTW